MSTRTRPGDVPAMVEAVDGLPAASSTSALDDVIAGRPLYTSAGADAAPPAPTMASRVDDLEIREGARERHIAVMDAEMAALIAEMQELRRQLGLEPWEGSRRD